MFARVSTYAMPAGRVDDGIQSFREAIERIRSLNGFREVYFLVDRHSEQAVTITLWDSVEAMEASRVAASRARSEAARAADGEVQSTSEYVVEIHETDSSP